MAESSTIEESEIRRERSSESTYSTDSERETNHLSDFEDDNDSEANQFPHDDFCRVDKKSKKRPLSPKRPQFEKKVVLIGKKPESGELYTTTNVKYFKRQMLHMKIGDRYEMDNQLLEFMRANYRTNVKSIVFHNSWSKTFADGLKFLLRDVEILDFMIFREDWERWSKVQLNEILQYSPLVKNLRVGYCVNIEVDYSNVKCPKLETFECRIEGTRVNELTTFFEQNRTIKRLTCRIHCLKKSIEMESIKWMLNTVIQTQPNINELFIDFVYNCEEIDFALIQHGLIRLDKRKSFKRLELHIDDTSVIKIFTVLASLKSFTGLHVFDYHFFDTEDKMLSLNSFVNLQILRFRGHMSDNFVVNLSKNLLNL